MNNGIFMLMMCIGAIVAGTVASHKNRSVGGWLVFGALFPLIAVIAIALVDVKPLPELE